MKQLLFLGDSITDCHHCFEPDNLGFGYVRMISHALENCASKQEFQIINKGNDGFTVSSVLRLWKSSASTLSPDFITILIGINDLAVLKNTGITEAIALAHFEKRYHCLLTEIRETCNCPILLMEPFIFPYPGEYATWKPTLLKFQEIIRILADSHQFIFLPLADDLNDLADTLGYRKITTDGIHLTDLGHQLLAQKWMDVYLHI